MSNIVVYNSCIVLEDYTLHACAALENFFKLYDPTTHQIYYKGIYYDEKERKLYLPRGLDIWYIENMMKTKAYIKKDSYNKFDRYGDISIKLAPRDEDQKKALRFMLGVGEYQYTQTKSQLSVNLNTGKGKTYVSIGTLMQTGIKSAIITYSINVLLQWKTRILEYTNIKPREIFEIEGTGSILRLLSKSEDEIKRIKVYLVSHGTIKAYGDANGWNKVRELFKVMRIGIKFYDEAHQNFDNMMMIDFFSDVYKTYYITATPMRSNQDENRIYQTAFKNVPAIDLFHGDTDPHTAYIAIRYNSRPEPYVISDCKNKYGLDRNKYINYIITNEQFLKVATIVLSLAFKMAKDKKDKILIYIGTNEAISKFYSWIVETFPEYRYDIGIYTSAVSTEDKESALQSKIILTTTKSAGAAVDIKGLKVTIVLAEPFKSEVLARQSLGRTRDDNTFYIDLVDKGFYYCNKYFLAKKKIFQTYAKSTEIIELSDQDIENRYNTIVKRLRDTSKCGLRYDGAEKIIGEQLDTNNKISDCNSSLKKPFIILSSGLVKPFYFGS